jgi:hypothetical protein
VVGDDVVQFTGDAGPFTADGVLDERVGDDLACGAVVSDFPTGLLSDPPRDATGVSAASRTVRAAASEEAAGGPVKVSTRKGATRPGADSCTSGCFWGPLQPSL